jgi:hypothetical protein
MYLKKSHPQFLTNLSNYSLKTMRTLSLLLFSVASALNPLLAQTPPLTITTNSTIPVPPEVLRAGSFLSFQLQATGGIPPYKFSLMPGQSLAKNLTLNSDTGVISGIPEAPTGAGFQIRVTDSASPANAKTKNFYLSISADAPSLPPVVFDPPAQVDKPFSFTFNATKGISPYTFTTNSTLPPGLKLSSGRNPFRHAFAFSRTAVCPRLSPCRSGWRFKCDTSVLEAHLHTNGATGGSSCYHNQDDS